MKGGKKHLTWGRVKGQPVGEWREAVRKDQHGYRHRLRRHSGFIHGCTLPLYDIDNATLGSLSLSFFSWKGGVVVPISQGCHRAWRASVVHLKWPVLGLALGTQSMQELLSGAKRTWGGQGLWAGALAAIERTLQWLTGYVLVSATMAEEFKVKSTSSHYPQFSRSTYLGFSQVYLIYIYIYIYIYMYV
jgi:hypothetical protein